MESSKKTKNANKSSNKEASMERNSSKVKKRKKKLTYKLGPHWTKVELERFYKAYRKHGRDWDKVAVAVQNNRSVDMVEALFSMHRAYLSVPEGTASVAGLIAMMTDHYSLIEGREREGEGEGHGASGVTRKHVKAPPSDIREEFISQHSIASTEGCLSQLRLTQAYRIERRATGKRTLRNANQRVNIQPEADDDDTRALASIRVGVSPNKRTEPKDVKLSQAEEAQSKHRASSMFENVVRISRGRQRIKGSPDRDGASLMDKEGDVGTVEVPQKEKNLSLEHAKVDVTEPSGDELEALRALTELSASLTPADLMALKSSADWEEQRVVVNTREQCSLAIITEKKTKQAGPEDNSLQQVTSAADNGSVICKNMKYIKRR